ncbi:MAG: hypothetical protein ABJN34_10120 [Litoreibacter sp.]|uniref:hypothetical protein n=1 Tax=Litoreibacter sp. TaxID=1969459 RepID=UPI003299842A
MRLREQIADFIVDETGIIDSDMFVLVAAGAILSVAVFAFVKSGVKQLDQDRGYQLEAQQKITTF